MSDAEYERKQELLRKKKEKKEAKAKAAAEAAATQAAPVGASGSALAHDGTPGLAQESRVGQQSVTARKTGTNAAARPGAGGDVKTVIKDLDAAESILNSRVTARTKLAGAAKPSERRVISSASGNDRLKALLAQQQQQVQSSSAASAARHRVDREPATGRAPGDAAKAAVPRPVVKASAISGGSSAMAAAAAALAREQGARGSGDAPSVRPSIKRPSKRPAAAQAPQEDPPAKPAQERSTRPEEREAGEHPARPSPGAERESKRARRGEDPDQNAFQDRIAANAEINKQWDAGLCESEAPSEAPRQWKKFDAPEGFSVFVGDLGGACSQEELQKALSSFGEVRSTRIIGDKGYGFAEFAQRSAAEEAIAASERGAGSTQEAKFAGSSSSAPQIRGQRIRVSWAHGKLPEWKVGNYGFSEGDKGREKTKKFAAHLARDILSAQQQQQQQQQQQVQQQVQQQKQQLPGFGEKSKSGMPSRSLVSYGDLF
ncbi:hypothetical protein CYMTET_16558 [Cymbomonas tetramitiformis]|uniref:RRM domain-containing protein n=1 Tax=Cymbomonas tetramitiformis TaxID=36881 RepID=A0AAE0GCB6_9CHLO|nr:hypothetical protein CYMTET_16558 [Cymbomonas tetramitiformis]